MLRPSLGQRYLELNSQFASANDKRPEQVYLQRDTRNADREIGRLLRPQPRRRARCAKMRTNEDRGESWDLSSDNLTTEVSAGSASHCDQPTSPRRGRVLSGRAIAPTSLRRARKHSRESTPFVSGTRARLSLKFNRSELSSIRSSRRALRSRTRRPTTVSTPQPCSLSGPPSGAVKPFAFFLGLLASPTPLATMTPVARGIAMLHAAERWKSSGD